MAPKPTTKAPQKAQDQAEAPQMRNFIEQELAELQELTRIANAKSFESKQIQGNTALIPDGAKLAEQVEAVARLLQNTKQHWVSQKLAELGWPKDVRVTIDLRTGVVIPEAGYAPKKK